MVLPDFDVRINTKTRKTEMSSNPAWISTNCPALFPDLYLGRRILKSGSSFPQIYVCNIGSYRN